MIIDLIRRTYSECSQIVMYAKKYWKDKMCTDLFLKGGVQLNLFVSHHKLLGGLSFGSSLVVRWRKLYFANHQTTCVPKVNQITQRELGLFLDVLKLLDSYENQAEWMVRLWAVVLLVNDFIYIMGCVGKVSLNLKVHATSLQQKESQINVLIVKHSCKSEGKWSVFIPCRNHLALAVRTLSMADLLASEARSRNRSH